MAVALAGMFAGGAGAAVVGSPGGALCVVPGCNTSPGSIQLAVGVNISIPIPPPVIIQAQGQGEGVQGNGVSTDPGGSDCCGG